MRAFKRSLDRDTDPSWEGCQLIVEDGPVEDGYTAKINRGCQRATGDYLVCSNDDVEVRPGWWPPLKAALDAGAQVVFPLTEGFMRYDLPAWHYAFTRATYERYSFAPGEWLDPSMRLTYSDTDLLERLRRRGVHPVFVPSSRIRHGLSKTLKTIDYAEQEAADRAAFEAKWSQRRLG